MGGREGSMKWKENNVAGCVDKHPGSGQYEGLYEGLYFDRLISDTSNAASYTRLR
jgi:hypothetical protein